MGFLAIALSIPIFWHYNHLCVQYAAEVQRRKKIDDKQARIIYVGFDYVNRCIVVPVLIIFLVYDGIVRLNNDDFNSDNVPVIGLVFFVGTLLLNTVALIRRRLEFGVWYVTDYGTPSFLKGLTKGTLSVAESDEIFENRRQRKRDWAKRKDQENLRKYGTRFP